jgi:hypothetical protein
MKRKSPKLRPISRVFRNCIIIMVSNNCMTTIIVVMPLKGTILNNKSEFYQKNEFYYVSLRTFQPFLTLYTDGKTIFDSN